MQANASQLEIRLFGHANVIFRGEPLKFAKRSTTLAMLALLVLRRGRPITRESLAFTLFPDADETTALAELRRVLYLTNKALPEAAGEPWLLVDADTARWNDASGAFVDTIAFEHYSARSETQAAAIELYCGDLLEDIYDDWVVVERERLRTRYLAVLSEALEVRRAARDFAGAIACATRILATDPWREDTLRSLIAVRYESGDTAGALAEFERFAKRLRDELTIAPMPETIAVRQSILRNDAVPGSLDRAPAHEVVTQRRALSILPFVGRRRELATLNAAWGRAARGAGAMIILSGEAGVGKTRLTSELARTAQAEGGRVFVGTTAAPESTPYQAIVEALRSALPLLLTRPPARARRATLARLLPELREPDMPEVTSAEASAQRQTARIFDALTQAIRGLASPRPLLLVLEDLQWAGSATIEALGAIVRELARAPILIVVTAREEETPIDHPLRALQRSLRVFQNVEDVVLERLSRDDVLELVTRVEGFSDRSDAMVHDLYAHTEGNALFLNESISGALERDGLERDGQVVRVPPASIATIVATRIARLSEDARTVSEIAAVAGSGCSVALIRDVSNLPAAAVARGLDELLDRRIVREASARASYDYVFTHHLIAQATYEAIEPGFRAQRHFRIAKLLETTFHETPTTAAREIARHYAQGGDKTRSADWYVTAAHEAMAVHAYGDAIDLAGRALRDAPTSELCTAALDVRERARGRRGDREGQREDIDALERLAGTDPQQRFDVLARRVLLARSLGESDQEGGFIAEMTALAHALGDPARAQALTQRATHAGLRSGQAEGIDPARKALAIYEQLADRRGQLECLYLLVDFTANTGAIEASRSYLALMRERGADLADRAVEARALAVAAQAALLRQEYQDSFDLTTRALALQIATNDREGEAVSRGRLAATCAWLGDFAMALRDFDLALATYESIGHKRGVALTHTNRTMLLMRLGLFADALVSIERSNALFDVVQEQRMIVANTVNESFVRLQLGDAGAAKALAESAVTTARTIGFPIFEAAALANLGNAEHSLGEFAAAIGHMEAGLLLRRPIQKPRDFVDDLSDLTLAYVSAGRTAEALATAHELSAIGSSSFDGAFWPHYVWWAVAQGFAAGGADLRADAAQARARAELTLFSNRIDDATARTAFLSLPINLRIAHGMQQPAHAKRTGR